jgi:hypothetical protein
MAVTPIIEDILGEKKGPLIFSGPLFDTLHNLMCSGWINPCLFFYLGNTSAMCFQSCYSRASLWWDNCATGFSRWRLSSFCLS